MDEGFRLITHACAAIRWKALSQPRRLAPVLAMAAAAVLTSACGSSSQSPSDDAPVTAAAATASAIDPPVAAAATTASATDTPASAQLATGAPQAPLPATPPAYRPTPTLGSAPFVTSVAQPLLITAKQGARHARARVAPLDYLDTVPPAGTVGAPVIVVVPGALPGPAQAMGLRPATSTAPR